MKGDFTRFTFNKTKHYTGVLKQQGRVDLDADWNEYVSIRDYISRTKARDIIGPCGVPEVTEGFKIGSTVVNGRTDLSISPGNIYVSGILCQNENDNAAYFNQPYYPNPDDINPENGRIDLVYIDVWQRHISALEDPQIREDALGGPDTTTRIQTIWQVKILQGEWPPPKSGAFLKTWVDTTAAPVNLCELPPVGGYTAMENRLYRVEIHDGSPDATFKWSRDNASSAYSIEEFVDSQIVRVKSLGRDQVVGLHIGDWVEVLGEETELKGNPGTLAKITNIDNAHRTVTLSEDISKHSTEAIPKLRKWDQGSGAIQVNTDPIELEDGIMIQFSGTNFRPGDYWAFAARTATGDVERLDNAPAHGIHHYYCKLALVTWNISGTTVTADVQDLRKTFPPLSELSQYGCCTVTVGDGINSRGEYTDIQEAVDSLENGGIVCILSGLYQLQDTVILNKDNIIIRGCGPQTKVTGPPAAPAFRIEGCERVCIKSLEVSTGQQVSTAQQDVPPLPVIEILGSTKACINDLDIHGLIQVWEGQQQVQSECISITSCRINGESIPWWHTLFAQGKDIVISENIFAKSSIWVCNASSSVAIMNNMIFEGPGPGIGLGGIPENESPPSAPGINSVDIQGNSIKSKGQSGITTIAEGEDIVDLNIAHNCIIDCALTAPDPSFGQMAVGGIVLRAASRIRIHNNDIQGNGETIGTGFYRPACGVFTYDCEEVDITDNRIVNNGSYNRQTDTIDLSMLTGQPLNSLNKGISFKVTDRNGNISTKVSTYLTQEGEGEFTGLYCEDGGRIQIDTIPSSLVELTLIFPNLSNTSSISIQTIAGTGGETKEITIDSTFKTVTVTHLTPPGMNQIIINNNSGTLMLLQRIYRGFVFYPDEPSVNVDFSLFNQGNIDNPLSFPDQGLKFIVVEESADATRGRILLKDINGEETKCLECPNMIYIRLLYPSSFIEVTMFHDNQGSSAKVEAYLDNYDYTTNTDTFLDEKTTSYKQGDSHTVKLAGRAINLIRIQGTGALVSFRYMQPDYQAGILALYVSSNSAYDISGPPSLLSVSSFKTCAPALRVNNNIVISPKGRALVAISTGPVSVTDNALVSFDIQEDPDPFKALYSTYTHQMAYATKRIKGNCVLIHTMSTNSYTQPNPLILGLEDTGTTSVSPLFTDIATKFSSNQVVLQAGGGASIPSSKLYDSLQQNSVYITSPENNPSDLSIQDNQFITQMDGLVYYSSVEVFANTIRACGNLFKEPLSTVAQLISSSFRSWAYRMNITTANQCTYHILASAPTADKNIVQNNLIEYQI